ncbi:MAG: hypothetical protein A2231_09595 [Candidatus Firestonebacteria bacterium RIFOXYA2_FULL_40_8]|nr:MAG: hypothetical protein A2231_09595 [Candidatus Firestonebacteria bacterium RIFOXYA2_FULL_40_8]
MNKINIDNIFKEKKEVLAVFLTAPFISPSIKTEKTTYYILFDDDFEEFPFGALEKEIREKERDEVVIEQVNPKDEKDKYRIFLDAKMIFTSDYAKTKSYIDNIIRFEYGVKNVKKVDPRSSRELSSEYEHLGDKLQGMKDRAVIVVVILSIVSVFGAVSAAKGMGLETNPWNGAAVLLIFGVFFAIGYYFYSLLNNLYFSDRGSKYQKGYSQAKAYILKKQYDKAVLEYKKEMIADSQNYEPHYQLAQLLESLGHCENAIMELQAAVQKTEDREVAGHIFQHMAEIYLEKMKDSTKAKHYLNKVVREYGDTRAGERAKFQLEKIP